MRQAGRAALRATLVLAIAGCADAAPVSPNVVPADLSGTWELGASLATGDGGRPCTSDGTATIAQSGNRIEGATSSTITCRLPEGTVNLTGFGSIDGGVSAGSVSFSDAECEYHGAVKSAQAMGGAATCSIFVGGALRAYAGSWEAHRTAD
jgi:hypothetical protein